MAICLTKIGGLKYVEHLAFFNKRWSGMKKSSLFKYYSEHEPPMRKHIEKDKKANSYKVTSRRMFEADVNIMNDVILDLNAKGIQVLYVYPYRKILIIFGDMTIKNCKLRLEVF